MTQYTYLGDKLTRTDLKGARCTWIKRPDGKCLVGKRPRNALVQFESGEVVVVLARRLRKIKQQKEP